MPIHPEVLWAQRSHTSDLSKNILYLTVKIPDAKNYKIDLSSTHLKIDSDSEDSEGHYKLDLEFFNEVNPETSTYKVNGNEIVFKISKKVAEEEYWPRLIKSKLKTHFIKTDFDKWVDEDEQDGEPPKADVLDSFNNNNFDFSSLAGGQGTPDFSQLASSFGGVGKLGEDGILDIDGKDSHEDLNTTAATDADFSSSDEEEEEEVKTAN